MTPSELKRMTQETAPYFFTRKTMKFFGDTMANYGVRKAIVKTHNRERVECWELYRKRPVKNDLQTSAYFDCVEWERIHGVEI